MKLFTIGFTKTTAENFFGRLKSAGVNRVVDVRLNNVSQLAGFAKRADLPYFLEHLVGATYVHMPELAPTRELLDEYRKQGGSWNDYAEAFNTLMLSRQINVLGVVPLRDGDCLLCSEDLPLRCHRRLVAEIAHDRLGFSTVRHL